MHTYIIGNTLLNQMDRYCQHHPFTDKISNGFYIGKLTCRKKNLIFKFVLIWSPCQSIGESIIIFVKDAYS